MQSSDWCCVGGRGGKDEVAKPPRNSRKKGARKLPLVPEGEQQPDDTGDLPIIMGTYDQGYDEDCRGASAKPQIITVEDGLGEVDAGWKLTAERLVTDATRARNHSKEDEYQDAESRHDSDVDLLLISLKDHDTPEESKIPIDVFRNLLISDDEGCAEDYMLRLRDHDNHHIVQHHEQQRVESTNRVYLKATRQDQDDYAVAVKKGTDLFQRKLNDDAALLGFGRSPVPIPAPRVSYEGEVWNCSASEKGFPVEGVPGARMVGVTLQMSNTSVEDYFDIFVAAREEDRFTPGIVTKLMEGKFEEHKMSSKSKEVLGNYTESNLRAKTAISAKRARFPCRQWYPSALTNITRFNRDYRNPNQWWIDGEPTWGVDDRGQQTYTLNIFSAEKTFAYSCNIQETLTFTFLQDITTDEDDTDNITFTSKSLPESERHNKNNSIFNKNRSSSTRPRSRPRPSVGFEIFHTVVPLDGKIMGFPHYNCFELYMVTKAHLFEAEADCSDEDAEQQGEAEGREIRIDVDEQADPSALVTSRQDSIEDSIFEEQEGSREHSTPSTAFTPRDSCSSSSSDFPQQVNIGAGGHLENDDAVVKVAYKNKGEDGTHPQVGLRSLGLGTNATTKNTMKKVKMPTRHRRNNMILEIRESQRVAPFPRSPAMVNSAFLPLVGNMDHEWVTSIKRLIKTMRSFEE
ncbi:unnamed protein product [Amoebophrya sp. A25]|nr:unnamed protein product [Amoebophrya sp. A25]|eukprot:GSA25T00027286001.1